MAVDFEKDGRSIKSQIIDIYGQENEYISKIIADDFKELSPGETHGASLMLMKIMHDILDEDDDDDNG